MTATTLLMALSLIAGDPTQPDDDLPTITLTTEDRLEFVGGEMPFKAKLKYRDLVQEAFKKQHPEGLKWCGVTLPGNNTLPEIQGFLDGTLKRRPTVIVLFTGTDDIRYAEKLKKNAGRRTGDPFDIPPRVKIPPLSPEQFTAALFDIHQKCTTAGTRLLLCTSMVIGEKHDGSNPLDPMLDEYAELTRKFAAQHKVPICDLRKEFIQYLKGHNPENKESGILTVGKMLSDAGHRFLAELLMMHLGIDPVGLDSNN
jgi:hypothetical protein